MKTHRLSARMYSAGLGVFDQFLSVRDHSLVCTHALERPSNMFATCNVCIGQKATMLPVLYQPYLLQVMYDISIPDSFMYTCYRSCI